MTKVQLTSGTPV